MPVRVDQATLAATNGHDPKRDAARRAVVMETFKEHLFDAEEEPDWDAVRRAMQCVDFGRPVVLGPSPPAPTRLVALPVGGPLGRGFFMEQPVGVEHPEWWLVEPHALYLKFYAPHVQGDARKGATETARYFLPEVRRPAGRKVARKERG